MLGIPIPEPITDICFPLYSEVAGVQFKIKGKSSYEVAKTAIDEMFAQRAIIIPGNHLYIPV